ncbi:MAG: enoyl-CoA hydratase/isomerase family protein [Deltaproteobacteria bacterium]
MHETIRLTRDEAIITLTLHRPEVLNAYDRRMRDEIFAALQFVTEEPDVKVLLVRGAGRAFGSGGDLREFGTAPSPLGARDIRQQRDVWRLWSELPCVSIAAVHGVAAGGGLEMALLCDLMIVARDARLLLPETGLAMIPGVGGTQTLPRAVGEGRAAEMLLMGREVSGAEAARIGLAGKAVAPAQLGREAARLARQVAAVPQPVLRAARAALRRGADLPLGEALRLEQRLSRQLRGVER